MAADEMKNEVRRDFLGRQIVVTVARASRPHDHAPSRAQKTVLPEKCFFCPGNERMTPQEIDRLEKGGKWEIRVFPNKFPAFDAASKKAYGRHEIIVETPDHQKTLSELSEGNLADYLSMLQKRMQEAERDSRLKYTCVFKNEGKSAGASLEHSHSQLVGMDFVPKYVQKLAKKAAAFAKMQSKEKKNIFFENDSFFAFCPKASRFHFEIWILPKQQVASLSGLSEPQITALASALKSVLYALDFETGFAPYNIVFHSAPHGEKLFPFHLQIIPRGAIWAGFEFGTEVVMLSSLPFECAKTLRKILAERK